VSEFTEVDADEVTVSNARVGDLLVDPSSGVELGRIIIREPGRIKSLLSIDSHPRRTVSWDAALLDAGRSTLPCTGVLRRHFVEAGLRAPPVLEIMRLSQACR
jgi:hypothetical protein